MRTRRGRYSWLCASPSKESRKAPRTGAPRSHWRTWDENDGAKPLRTLSLGARDTVPEGAVRNEVKALEEHRFRPMYAEASMGHPSRTSDAVSARCASATKNS
jgi:hypothetical protein